MSGAGAGKKTILTQQMVFILMDSCMKKAEELNIAVNVSVMDEGGNLKGFLRMDGAPLMGGKIAQDKSYTAVGFGVSTADWYALIKDQPELLHGVVHIDRMTIFGGGEPVYEESELIGGIGVSGGTADQDDLCAKAAVQALKNRRGQ